MNHGTNLKVKIRASWACLLLCLTANAMAKDEPRPAPAEAKPSIVFIDSKPKASWHQALGASIKEHADQHGFGVRRVEAKDAKDQFATLARLRRGDARAVVIYPLTAAGWEESLAAAKRAQIPVVFVDRSPVTFEKDLYACVIEHDFGVQGRKAGEMLAKTTGGKAEILELQGDARAKVTMLRSVGCAEAIQQHKPGMRVVAELRANFMEKEAQEAVARFLADKDSPVITAIYAHNDAMARGAIAALEAAGKKPGKDVLIVSIDGEASAIRAVAEGKLLCTVEHTPQVGPALMKVLQLINEGREVPRRVVLDDPLIDAEAAKARLAKPLDY